MRRRGTRRNGMPRRSAYRICLPYFAAVGATSAAIPRDAQRARPRRRQPRGAPRPARRPARRSGIGRLSRTSPRANSGPSSAGHAERDADAGVGRAAVAGQRVVAAARADRAERLEPGHPGLVDRARVVVQPARDAQVGDARSPGRTPRPRALDHLGQLGQAGRPAGRSCTPERPHLVDERRVGRRRSRPARRQRVRQRRRSAPPGSTSTRARRRADLVELVDRAHHRRATSVDAQPS